MFFPIFFNYLNFKKIRSLEMFFLIILSDVAFFLIKVLFWHILNFE